MYIAAEGNPTDIWRKYFMPYRITLPKPDGEVIRWRAGYDKPLICNIPAELDIFAVRTKLRRLCHSFVGCHHSLRIEEVHIDCGQADLIEVRLDSELTENSRAKRWALIDQVVGMTFNLPVTKEAFT